MEFWVHQKNILSLNPSYVLLAWAPGVGKTLALLELAKQNAFSVLVLCPKSLVKKWEIDIQKVGAVDTKILSPYWFKKYHKELPYYDCIIIDEADSPWFGSNQSSKALFAYLKKHNPSYLFMGTGTAYRSTPLNIYNAGRICKYMPMAYPEFREKFFFQEYFGAQPVWTPKMKHKDPAVKAQTQKDLYEYMKPFADIVRMEDVFDVPEQLFDPVEIGMTDKQEKTLKELDLLSENRSTFFRYSNEIENGWLDAKGLGEEMEFDSLKVERVLEMADEYDTAIVFSLYRHQQQKLYDAIKKKHKKAYVAMVNGDNSEEAPVLSGIVEQIAKGEHPKYTQAYLVASVGVAAGWECSSVPLAIYASLPWSYQQWEQSQKRILRGDNLKSNRYTILLGGQVDSRIWQSLKDSSDYDPVKHAEEETLRVAEQSELQNQNSSP